MTNVILPARPVRPELSPELILRVAWRSRRWILLSSLGWAVLGVVVALLLQPEYVAEVKVMPELANGTDGAVRQLASMAGFSALDLSETEGMDAIRPDLYPNVLQSTPFLLYLIDQPLSTADDSSTTVGQLVRPENAFWQPLKRLVGGHTTGVQSASASKGAAPMQLSVRQKRVAEAISERVGARFDTRSGIITISARMPDARAAAEVAKLAMTYLTRYVTEYRTEKARRDLTFYENRLREAQNRHQKARLALFRHNDQHKSLILQTATLDRQQLGDELTLAQSVYAELARQYEQARLKVQERTPVFKVLEPPTVPLDRVSPRRTLLVLGFALLGGLLGVGYRLLNELQWSQRWRHLIQQAS